MRFLNFTQRLTHHPELMDCREIFQPLTEALCKEGVQALSAEKNLRIPLFYLTPLNSFESLWRSLPDAPFQVGGATLTPMGFVDEFGMLILTVCARAGRAGLVPPYDVYALFRSDACASALRFSCRSREGKAVLTPLEAFPLYDPPSAIADPAPWSVFSAGDVSPSAEELRRLEQFLRELGASHAAQEDLGSAAYEEMLSAALLGWAEQGAAPFARLTRYFGLWDGAAAQSVKLLGMYPSGGLMRFTVRVTAKNGDSARMTPFMGYVSDPRYCLRFAPFAAGTESANGVYGLSCVFEDAETAWLHVTRPDAAGNEETPLRAVKFCSPHALLRKRNSV
jgi:hypothetical protein